MEKVDPEETENLFADQEYCSVMASHRQRKTSWPNLYVVIVSLCLITIMILQTLTLYHTTFRNTRVTTTATTPSVYKVWKGCGSNFTEARSLGCVFDVMMNAWTRQECYNKGLSEEFLTEWNFQFFYDAEGRREIPLSVMRRGEHDHMYSTEYQHRGHCIYTWKMQALALEAQGRGEVQQCDDETFSYHHTIHCADILANSPREPPFAMGYGDVKFLSCGPYLE